MSWDRAAIDAGGYLNAGVAEQSNKCWNGVEDCPGPDADVLPCLECLTERSDRDWRVATDGGETDVE
ncbi:hypothetical protein [Haloterrigena turkmenica]|uniref:hypothetical protein n=1 Tax=Haloterrigena turkmenica TaxID=62320 RepID=UPI0011D14005|nr:hypothetical protein [Haloterrigena turkmenica]